MAWGTKDIRGERRGDAMLEAIVAQGSLVLRKVGGGRITIRASRRGDRSFIEVEDDGLGMTEERLQEALHGGIGLSNVNERLRTIYGASCSLKLASSTGHGTSVSVELPDLTLPERLSA